MLVVDVPGGRVVGQLGLPEEPEFVAGNGGVPVVVSSASGSITLVDLDPVHVLKTFHDFVFPDIATISPDGADAYVADGATGKLTVIGVHDERSISTVTVGHGAHHLAFSSRGSQAWVALGEDARTIAILSTVMGRPSSPASAVIDPGHPHLIGHFDPGFLAHDVVFSPDGRQVWITAARTSYASVFSARNHRLLFRVPGGPPPQHVAIEGNSAYLTSGYGSFIERVKLNSGRVIRRAPAPYGSFDLAAADGYIITVSLFRGTVAIYNRELRLLHVRQLAPSIKDVALASP